MAVHMAVHMAATPPLIYIPFTTLSLLFSHMKGIYKSNSREIVSNHSYIVRRYSNVFPAVKCGISFHMAFRPETRMGRRPYEDIPSRPYENLKNRL